MAMSDTSLKGHIRAHPAPYLVGFVGLVTVLALFFVQEATSNTQRNAIASRDNQIKNLNTEVSRLGVAYAQLRDQDFSVGLIPAAPSLSQVENPKVKAGAAPIPKSVTFAIGGLYLTCSDKTGQGNFVCTSGKKPPATNTPTTTTTPSLVPTTTAPPGR